MTEHEIVGWHHRLSGHEFDETLGVSEGQGSLVCCSPSGCKESDIYWLGSVHLIPLPPRSKSAGWGGGVST